jgi:peptide deformylase
MTSSTPLKGVILVDCAKANAKYGIGTAAEQCGYGKDIVAFETALKTACENMGISLKEFTDLSPDSEQQRPSGIEVAPDTNADL